MANRLRRRRGVRLGEGGRARRIERRSLAGVQRTRRHAARLPGVIPGDLHRQRHAAGTLRDEAQMNVSSSTQGKPLCFWREDRLRALAACIDTALAGWTRAWGLPAAASATLCVPATARDAFSA